MKTLKQWINWKLEPKPGEIKLAKIPFCYRSERRIDAHDPTNWLTYDEARALDGKIGIVLTKNTPYFCVDLDHALKKGVWSEHSKKTVAWFPGAYTEISFSGDGLHIFGRCNGEIPAHKKRVKFGDDDTELYTAGRFIAFTGVSCSGDYNTDLTTQLHEFIKVVMPPEQTIVSRTNNSELYGGYLTPDPEWIGPDDDNELIKKMLASKKSVGNVLNDKADIRDLWTANVEALTKTYPDKKRPYNESSADAALFSHLAFWTGRDGPRMERMARKSALMRDKWDKHPNYLKGVNYTIHKACDRCKQVYRDPKRVSETEAAKSNNPNYLFGSQFLSVTAQVSKFQGCVYILDSRSVFVPYVGVLKPDQFNDWFGGATFAIDHEGKLTTKKAFDAFTCSQGFKFPKAMTSCFRPENKPGEVMKINGRPCVNTYIPAIVNFGTGDVSLFLFILSILLPNKRDYDIFLNYAAACVQYPGVKFRWWPVLYGVEGNGKTIPMECIGHAMGEQYVGVLQTPDAANKFNAEFSRKLFIIVEEIHTSNRQEIFEALKPIITNKKIAIQKKGVDTITEDNRLNGCMATNHLNALMKTVNDRRLCALVTAQSKKEHLKRDGLTNEFFMKLGNWLDYQGGRDDVAGFLKRFKIDESLNPATTLLTAPDSSTTKQVIEASQSVSHQEIQEAIDEGIYGFRGGWISSYALTKLLESKNLVRFLPIRKRKDVLGDLGYIPMPWVSKGRSPKQLASEGGTRPTLYIKESFKYGNPLTTNDYVNAQSENK
jgi:primase-polymerase (primpol)-like protein